MRRVQLKSHHNSKITADVQLPITLIKDTLLLKLLKFLCRNVDMRMEAFQTILTLFKMQDAVEYALLHARLEFPSQLKF